MRKASLLPLFVALAMGCSGSISSDDAPPIFSLAWSEYPSWSAFGVAHERGLIDGAAGKFGPIEHKYNVDIELRELDYDPCITQLGQGSVDAACITNIDSIAPAKSLDLVAILPTSTSVGGDGLLAPKGTTIEDLKSKEILGLEKSVSQYVAWRCLEEAGQNPKDFKWKNMDPGVAAQGMSQKQDGFDAIMVWNPFLLQTQRNRGDEISIVFDSAQIPEEVIDQVVVSKKALEREGGDRFAKAICETFYEVNKFLQNPETRDKTLVQLGERFSNLDAGDMAIVTTQTRFYDIPEKGIELYTGQTIKDTQGKVQKFATEADLVDSMPTIGFGQSDTQLNFDPQYIQAISNN